MTDLAEIVDAVRGDLAGLLLATDFDGTLAPIVPDPRTSRPLPGAVDALRRIGAAGARVAVITGRDARTVIDLGGMDVVAGLHVAGLYGAEEWRDGAVHTPETPPAMQRLRDRLPTVVERHASDPRVWIEDKRLSLVVHGRLTDAPEGALDPLRAPLAELADELELEVHPGRGVIELRLPGIDKGGALRRLVERTRPRQVLYVGDDVGDLPAFEQIGRLRAEGIPAWGVAVVSAEAPEVAEAADARVGDPAGVLDLLRAIAG